MAVLNTRDGFQHIGHPGGALEIPPLPESTILLVEVGSTAHGTGLPGGEDNAEMGVLIEFAARSPRCRRAGLRHDDATHAARRGPVRSW